MSISGHSHDELSIPAVTQDDLAEFHVRRFGPGTSLPPAPVWFSTSSNQNSTNDQPPQDDFDEEDDGLGYYPDGVKRTLTDDQIAIFRHSEIQALLREQRRRSEREQDEREAQREAQQSPSPARVSHKSIEITENVAIGPSNDKRTSTQLNEQTTSRKRRKKSQKPNSCGPSTKSLHIAPEDPQGRTTRRLAREMDEVQANSSIELDY